MTWGIEAFLVPFVETTHDRIAIEIMRGCPWQCRFCQSTVIKRPLRYRTVETIINAALDLGAFTAFALGQAFGLGFWPSLIIAPVLVGLLGAVLERTLLSRLYGLEPSYNLLLTFGLTLLTQDLVKQVMLSRFAVSSGTSTIEILSCGGWQRGTTALGP